MFLLPGWKLKGLVIATKTQKRQIFHAFVSATHSVAFTSKQPATWNTHCKAYTLLLGLSCPMTMFYGFLPFQEK